MIQKRYIPRPRRQGAGRVPAVVGRRVIHTSCGKRLADETLASPHERFQEFYSLMGRPSIAPEMLPRATLLQAFFSVRSERLPMETISVNVGMYIGFVTACLSFQRRISVRANAVTIGEASGMVRRSRRPCRTPNRVVDRWHLMENASRAFSMWSASHASDPKGNRQRHHQSRASHPCRAAGRQRTGGLRC